jgi:isopentenyl-diphosphate delta-isomerase
VHLNVTHELAQDDGDRDFDGIVAALAKLVETLEGRVLVKETGAGLSPQALALLAGCGVKYIDVAGAGGTSWTRVEGYRVRTPKARAVAETFADWGIPTAFSIIAARRCCPPDCCIIGSGGILNGLDAARAIACGARVAGVARSLLLAYMDGGVDGAASYLRRLVHELRCAMLLCSAASVEQLQHVHRVYTGRLREWLSAYRWLDELEQNA